MAASWAAAPALGGGLLIDGGNVALSNVAVMNNAASGGAGADGSVGRSATQAYPTGGPGAAGGAGGNARGGGIYLASGNLTLTNDLIQGNVAQGGAGGAGGRGGYGFTVTSAGDFIGSFHSGNGGPGGNGGAGGSGVGGGLYIAGGTLAPLNSVVLGANAALGGAGAPAGLAVAPACSPTTSRATAATVGRAATAAAVRCFWLAAACKSTVRA